jgi:hypothetical protein
MPTFYFDIHNGEETIKDVEGVELSGARAAFEEAQEAAREILSEKLARGDIIDGNQFEVHDEMGTKLFTLPFKSVLRFE